MKLQFEIEYDDKKQGVAFLQRVSESLGFIPKFQILEYKQTTAATKYSHLKLIKPEIAC